MKRLYVSTDIGTTYITAGKWYRCYGATELGANIIVDSGNHGCIFFNNCAYLCGRDWKVMTVETISDEPLYNYTRVGETFVNLKGQMIKVMEGDSCAGCVLDDDCYCWFVSCSACASRP